MTFLDSKKTLCSLKLNISYDNVVAGKNSLFSVQDIEDALNGGIRRAWDYKLWPISEANTDVTNIVGVTPYTAIAQSDLDGIQGQSTFLAIVNGVPWSGQGAGKRNFSDFMKWIADYPTDTSKIWAEYGETFYFNGNALGAGNEINLFGKLHAPSYNTGDDSFGDDTVMPFSLEDDNSDTESSGNEAVIQFAYASILSSDKKKNPTQAAVEEKKAYGILDTLWTMISEGKAQNMPQNRPMFNVDNFFPGNRSNRYNTNTGNFP